jgi:hypothetical protein
MARFRLLSLVVSVIAAEIFASPILAIPPEQTPLAQAVDQSLAPIRRLSASMFRYCNRTTELSYRSQRLTSPDGVVQVYIEGMLRKTVNDPNRSPNSADYCYADKAETVSNQLIIETETETYQISGSTYDAGYIIYHPQAFSADGRYLATVGEIVYDGLSTESFTAIFDLVGRKALRTPNLCLDLDSSSHVGFTTANEVVVRCDGYSSRPPIEARYEAVSLPLATVRRLSARPSELANYGTLVGELEVIQTQLSE